MAPIVSNCIRVSATGTNLTGRPWAVVQHLVKAGAGAWNIADMADSWMSSFTGQLMPVLSAAVNVTGGQYVDLRTLDGISGPITGVGYPVAGGGSGTMCPPNTAILVKMATSGSRSQRSGRMFLPGVDEDQVDATGTLTGGYVDDLQDAVDDYWNTLTTANLIPVVNSKASTTTYEPTTITGMQVQTLCATQRRRLRR